jgi:arylsulfatase A-like enzyme
VVILTSDHGDAFMEHGFISHSVEPYDELIKVPLILTLPEGVNEAQGSVPAQVRLIDVMPTILDLAGADAPADLDGRSLGRLIVKGADKSAASEIPEPFAISEVEVQTGEGTQFFVSIRSREQKYLASLADPPELYDLVNDPGEQVNLMPVSPERTEVYRHIVQRILEAREDLGAGRISLDEQTIEQLKALGYLE